MKMLEIQEKEFINLDKVVMVMIKEDIDFKHEITGSSDKEDFNFTAGGYKLEFELDNNKIISSKMFHTVEEARMWLFEHTKGE